MRQFLFILLCLEVVPFRHTMPAFAALEGGDNYWEQLDKSTGSEAMEDVYRPEAKRQAETQWGFGPMNWGPAFLYGGSLPYRTTTKPIPAMTTVEGDYSNPSEENFPVEELEELGEMNQLSKRLARSPQWFRDRKATTTFTDEDRIAARYNMSIKAGGKTKSPKVLFKMRMFG